ncbi:DUF4326 domain-containing protein [uncultured Methanomethylovorans sp.]|uniref:DUF4326 domain-containing protein n=1 Tax=uncultured Methanomethylovorans sp. TaxID=183759 RepID=UPI002AA680C9|nr:DUF4326 domain-containing protein [uncultured Methanomethylovorans sp.]
MYWFNIVSNALLNRNRIYTNNYNRTHLKRQICLCDSNASTTPPCQPSVVEDGVVDKYRTWLLQQDHLLVALPELFGKTIACWCAPFACHGDILTEFAEMLEATAGNTKMTAEEIRRILS